MQEATPQGPNHWLQKAAPTHRPKGGGRENREQHPSSLPFRRSSTSTGFLRLLRSLAILAFLSCFRFFSSRSLSPSLLEELAEALLSNLPRRVGLRLTQGQRTAPHGLRAGKESKDTRPEMGAGGGPQGRLHQHPQLFLPVAEVASTMPSPDPATAMGYLVNQSKKSKRTSSALLGHSLTQGRLHPHAPGNGDRNCLGNMPKSTSRLRVTPLTLPLVSLIKRQLL